MHPPQASLSGSTLVIFSETPATSVAPAANDGEDNPLERAGFPAFDRGPALTACLRNRAPQAVRTVRYKRFVAFFT
jgi:hypothetical protein